ncbi:hypothetical protein CR513_62705, partial [Mucuna pruriens]
PIRLGRKGPKLLHIAIVNNHILFVEYKWRSYKFVLMCSTNALSRSNEFGYKRTNDLRKYLGVHIHHKQDSRSTFRGLACKVKCDVNQVSAKCYAFYVMQRVSKRETMFITYLEVKSPLSQRSNGCDDIMIPHVDKNK